MTKPSQATFRSLTYNQISVPPCHLRTFLASALLHSPVQLAALGTPCAWKRECTNFVVQTFPLFPHRNQCESASQNSLSRIAHPVFLINVRQYPCLVDHPALTKDSNEVYLPDAAFNIVNAKDGAELYFVRGACAIYICTAHADTCVTGASCCLGTIPESASIVNRDFASFLVSLLPARRGPLLQPRTGRRMGW